MKRQVFIYDRNKESLDFLKGFFKGNPGYTATFFTNVKDLKKAVRSSAPYAVIVGSPTCLDRLKPGEAEYPVLAMVSNDVAKGMRSVVRNGVETYMLSPYVAEDIEYKLNVLGKRSDGVAALYQEKEDLETVVDLTYKLSSTLDPEEVLYLIVRKISEIIPVSRCSILSISFGEERFARVVSTFESHQIKHITLDIGKYPEIDKALKTRQAVIIKDALHDPLMKKVRKIIEPLGIRSIMVIPIIFRDEVIGTLFLRTSRKGHTFTEREVKLCDRIAHASANALNNAFLFEKVKTEKAELKKLSITDFLTGVYNVRYFYHRLSEEFSRAQRYGTDLSCIMFDIDYFKNINDTYGHRTGDMVLREFAMLVKALVRQSDVLARYGGEEFILLLPHTNKENSIVEAERLASAVRKHKFKGLKARERITISIGIASYPDDRIKTQDTLINFADDALLKAKQGGRDRIAVSG
ncbi:MAG: sensor domain-containing diguanylate cyclase [Nitrospirota bacterium]